MTAAKKKSAELSYEGVRDAGKVSEESVDAALAKLDIAPAKKDLAGKVAALVAHFDKVAKQNVGDCSNCGAVSDIEAFGACPFCGEGEDETRVSEGDGPEQAGENDDPQEVLDASPEPREEKLKGKTTKGEKKQASLALVPKAEPTAEVLPKGAKTEGDLDAAIQSIRKIQQGAQGAAWMVGRACIELQKSALWKLRKNAEGGVAYKTFEECAKAELEMTPQYLGELQRIAAKFELQAVEEYGVTKLRLVLQAPPGKQDAVMRALKAGKSRNEILHEVFGRKGAAGKVKEKQRARDAGEVTVAMVEGKKSVKLWTRKSVEAASEDSKKKAVAAKKVVEQPVGWRDLGNDVREHFSIVTNDDGELRLVVEVRRIEH